MLTKKNQETKAKIYSELISKTEQELAVLCKDYSLEPVGSKKQIVQELTKYLSTNQDLLSPQAFAIKTKSNAEAQDWVRLANARILPQDKLGNVLRDKLRKAKFSFPSQKGTYELTCPFVPASKETVLKLINKGWLYSLDSQRLLLAQLRDKIDHYRCSLLRKKDVEDGRFYLMLHVQPK